MFGSKLYGFSEGLARQGRLLAYNGIGYFRLPGQMAALRPALLHNRCASTSSGLWLPKLHSVSIINTTTTTTTTVWCTWIQRTWLFVSLHYEILVKSSFVFIINIVLYIILHIWTSYKWNVWLIENCTKANFFNYLINTFFFFSFKQITTFM